MHAEIPLTCRALPACYLLAACCQLAQRVQASAVGAAAPAVLDSIQAALQGQQQYRVFVRRALGGGEGSLCLHNLRHTFLSVQCPGAPLVCIRCSMVAAALCMIQSM